ncbi:MAG: hypothetical protein JWR69_3034 [Pedosphaera sp.]|nr:hypothetical protein [Pedosphaera sp.]
MKTVEVISDASRPVAFLIPQELSPAQIRCVRSLGRESFEIAPDLARRWGLASVIADRDWAGTQRHRVPMLKPKGMVLGFAEVAR